MLDGLGAGSRDAPARQRTLAAAIEWSYTLLDEHQRRCFKNFAVFAGGATVAAAEAVTGGDLETIEALLRKSLIARRRAVDGSVRLAMLETIREYAFGLLAEDHELDAAHQRHLQHYQQLVERNAPQLWSHGEEEALRVLDREVDNLRAALRWALDGAPTAALVLAGHLAEYWWICHDPDGLDWLQAALLAAGDDAPIADRAYAQLKLSFLLGLWGEHSAKVEAATASLELYREIGDEVGIANAYCSLANSAASSGDHAAHGSYAAAACEHARASGDEVALGRALAVHVTAVPQAVRAGVLAEAADLLARTGHDRDLVHLYANAAFVVLLEDGPAEALPLLESALRGADRIGTPRTRMITLGNLALARLLTGKVREAAATFEAQLELCSEHGFRFGADEGLAGLAAVAAQRGSDERAARLLGAAHCLGYAQYDPAMRARLDADFHAPARIWLEATAWQRAWREGEAMTLERAIAYALEPASSPHPGPRASS